MTGRIRTKQDAAKRRIGPEARDVAMALLAEGYSVTAVAAEMKVKRETVIRWRETVDGQKALAKHRASRTEALKGTADRARAILEAGAIQAAETLVELVGTGPSKDRIRASATLLDRIGVPRTERLEVEAPGEDLTALTDDELAELERLRAKAKGSR